ncbi:hypothetical protein F8388_024624 [Cannabis sativa]|uniref:MATH domain-containing protein n=1 Tax=Cannabis sativa TaxID=3483 RepID=A0A7J6GBK9_CANSA|nr:hypothetical protein F8388_024624 [Cannabis sativa]
MYRQLSFYPNKDKNYLSLYLTIIWCNDDDESDDIASSIGWEVNVNFTLFVYNQTKDNYLAFQGVRRFHEMKKEWGFEQIISLETFKDVHNGYVVNDSCVFGAEVFIINQTAPIFATLSVVQRRFIDNPIFRWEIKEFSKIMNKYEHNSQVFSSGGIEHLSIGPDGQRSIDGKSLTMFLMMEHLKESTTYVEFCLRVIDQLNSKHKEFKVNKCYPGRNNGWGASLMSLEDLHNNSNYYVVKDTLILEVDFSLISRTKFV